MQYIANFVKFNRYPTLYIAFKMAEAASFSVDIGGMRVKYKDKRETFTEDNLSCKEPIGQFKCWFDDACNTPEIIEANAMCLATCSKDGLPSARYVLLKGYGKDGFKFFTHYTSRKGQDLQDNPRAALVFYWDCLKRSVRIEGTVEKLSELESEEYFRSRPKESQLGAAVSQQSHSIPSRSHLVLQQNKLREKFAEEDVSRPPQWGGYLVRPESVEFWQGQSDRLHDRIRFRRSVGEEVADGVLLHQGEEGWLYERLAP